MTDEWTLQTIREHFQIILTEMDRRYEQRFLAQEKAVDLALARVDKEFHEHLEAVREENRLALSAQDKAVAKQEVSTEKRFENVNEFRGQLSDQVAKFITRQEVDRTIGEIARRFDDLGTTLSAKIDAIAKSMDAKIDTVNERISGVEQVTR